MSGDSECGEDGAIKMLVLASIAKIPPVARRHWKRPKMRLK